MLSAMLAAWITPTVGDEWVASASSRDADDELHGIPGDAVAA